MTSTPTSATSLRKLPGTSSVDELVSVVKEDGGVIIEDFLTPEQVVAINLEIDPDLDKVVAGSRKRSKGSPTSTASRPSG
jgi:hypothetical protein